MHKRLMQMLGIFCMVLIWSMILHKGYADVSAIALKSSDGEFWRALAQYLVRNLAGG